MSLRSFVADGRGGRRAGAGGTSGPQRRGAAARVGPADPDVRFEDMAVVGHNPSCVLDLYQGGSTLTTGRCA